MAADLTYPSLLQRRQDGSAAIPTGVTLTVESGGAITAASGSTTTLAGTTTITGATTLNGNTLTATTGTATITIPNSTDTLVNLTSAQTLSSKTLTDPIITNVTRASAQLDRTDTTLTNIAGLVQTVAVGTYRFRYVLPVTCGGTGGTKTAFKYTTTVVSVINYSSLGYTAAAVAVANGTTTTDQATHIASNTAAILVVCEGTMVVTTGGTVQLQFGENSANSTSSVLIGAYMEFTRIA